MISMNKLRPLMDEAFRNGQTFSFPINGTSMKPLLHTGDSVKIKDIKDYNIKKGDIILYQRDDESYILHRVRKIKGDNLTMVGDHQTTLEHNVNKDRVIAYAISYKKRGKEAEYNLKGFKYAIYKLLVKIRPIRWIFSHE